jgi:hypothetical protein
LYGRWRVTRVAGLCMTAAAQGPLSLIIYTDHALPALGLW